MHDELVRYDAVGLGELIRKGEISSVELLDITIQRIEQINPRLNAIIHKIFLTRGGPRFRTAKDRILDQRTGGLG